MINIYIPTQDYLLTMTQDKLVLYWKRLLKKLKYPNDENFIKNNYNRLKKKCFNLITVQNCSFVSTKYFKISGVLFAIFEFFWFSLGNWIKGSYHLRQGF